MINYDKWNKLDDYSSEEEESHPRMPMGPKVSGAPVVKLYTIPWDPYCEEIRWALDRHGMGYVEHAVPWGLHLWSALSFSDPHPHKPQTSFPILENEKKEIYKRDTTDIFMYLFAHSFHNRIRIYSAAGALELQQGFDRDMGPAVIRIFLSTLLSNPDLTEKYLISNVHLNTWKTLNRLFWPLIRQGLWYTLGLDKKNVETAWKTVREIFMSVETEMEKNGGRKYISGDTLSASDISFASHASLILFPNETDDTFAGGLGFRLPSLKELPREVADAARSLRATKAGKHALRMYRKERVPREKPEGFRQLPSRFAKESNPWWASDEGERLMINVYGCLFAFVASWGMILFTMPYMVWAVVFAAHCLVVAIIHFKFYRNSTLEAKVKQLWFLKFGIHKPTERDIIEQESLKKQKSAQITPQSFAMKPNGGDESQEVAKACE
ncbi:hypothetical protein HDU67_000923 [Dinochytrium kinnereticum]|nr:hypothetical protein HDU67_000923 [Dinochytrium kinnereticum]